MSIKAMKRVLESLDIIRASCSAGRMVHADNEAAIAEHILRQALETKQDPVARLDGEMSRHTSGPWIVGKVNRGPVSGTVPVHTKDYMESHRSGQLICSVYGTAAFSEANARLIAAAPDLLSALDDLARYADTCELFLRETHPGKADMLRKRVTAAIDAMAKATGGEV